MIHYINALLFRSIQNELRQEVLEARLQSATFAPKLAIVQVGGREDSNVYIRMKLKAAQTIGVEAEHIRLPSDITETEVSLDFIILSLPQAIWHSLSDLWRGVPSP